MQNLDELRTFAKKSVETDQVTFSDACVSEELRAAFVKGLDMLVAHPPHGEADWHPGSGQKVKRHTTIFHLLVARSLRF